MYACVLILTWTLVTLFLYWA